MFDRLTDSFNGLFRKLSGNAKLSEKNIADAVAEVRTSLLEADVSLEVINDFTTQVMQEAVGKEVTKSLQPGQEMIGIVYDKLVALLGDAPAIPAGATPHDARRSGCLADHPGPDGGHDVRAARQRQDDHLRQAGRLAAQTQPLGDAGGG